METEDWHLSSDHSLLQIDRVHAWLAATYWSPNIRLDVVKLAFQNSLVMGAYTNEREQIGVARVVTDYATFGWNAEIHRALGRRRLPRAVTRSRISSAATAT